MLDEWCRRRTLDITVGLDGTVSVAAVKGKGVLVDLVKDGLNLVMDDLMSVFLLSTGDSYTKPNDSLLRNNIGCHSSVEATNVDSRVSKQFTGTEVRIEDLGKGTDHELVG